jgi:hypothetical protein
LYKAFLVFVVLWVPFLVSCIEREFSEEMAMFVAFSASERNVFIVNGLGPVLVMILQRDGSWEQLSYVQIKTDLRV